MAARTAMLIDDIFHNLSSPWIQYAACLLDRRQFRFPDIRVSTADQEDWDFFYPAAPRP